MKDAYSFHSSEEDLDREYYVMADTYKRIFERCGLETRMVRSDSGAIGGDVSHEFMVLTQTHSGECDVYYCNACDYAANSNRAESILPDALTDGSDLFPKEAEVETPNCPDIESLAKFLKCPPSLICKALLYIKDETEPFLVLIRGDLEAEHIKIQNAVDAHEIRMATPEEITKYTGSEKGYIGPADVDSASIHDRGTDTKKLIASMQGNEIQVIPDASIVSLKNFVIAANKPGYHHIGFNWKRVSLFSENVKDIKLARVGDTCPECKTGKLEMTRGIEVGNIFKLGDKYSKKMGANYSTEDGQELPFLMGCYGIGISRTAASAVERHHDENGIIWPIPIAPYQVVVVPVNVSDETQSTMAIKVYEGLQTAGVEVVMDDRDERAGVKFKDADLLGFPIRVTAGKKAVDGLLEVKLRAEKDPKDMPAGDVVAWVQAQIKTACGDVELAHV